MFRTAPVVEPAPDVKVPADLVPLSHLELDLPAPLLGWPAYLSSRDIAVVEDSIGRRAVASADAKLLMTEHRDKEAAQAEKRAAAELAAVERDQQFRASLGRGVPASALPPGVSYAEAVAAAELNAHPYRPRASVVEDLLDNGGGGYVFHPIQHNADE